MEHFPPRLYIADLVEKHAYERAAAPPTPPRSPPLRIGAGVSEKGAEGRERGAEFYEGVERFPPSRLLYNKLLFYRSS